MTKNRSSQSGQALAEGVVVFLALAAMSAAIAWLYRWQDIALQASHASRALAFEHVRNPLAQETSDVVDQLLQRKQRWNDIKGNTLLPDGSVQWSIEQQTSGGSAHAFPELAANAWQELGFETDAIATASVQVGSDGGDAMRMPALSLWQPSESDRQTRLPGLQLIRSTSILSVSAGHSENHRQVQQRIGQSTSLWRSVADVSVSLGRKTDTLMRPVDAAWNRPAPSFDWLAPWAGKLPPYLKSPHE